MSKPYVYKVTNKITGQFYYGSRVAHIHSGRHPADDLWVHYFTSSKNVKNLINEYGIHSFDIEIVSIHDDYDSCFWEEQRLILENKFNPLRLNKRYVDPTTGKTVLTTFNETPEQLAARSKKVSDSKKGKFNSNGHYGLKHSEETKQRMRNAQAKLNYKHSEETKQRMRDHQRSDEHSKKLSESLKGKPWSDARRKAYLLKKGQKNGKSSI